MQSCELAGDVVVCFHGQSEVHGHRCGVSPTQASEVDHRFGNAAASISLTLCT